MASSGALLTLQIERPAVGGRMIARHDGTVVLVAGAIPGERVTARVERVQRRTIWARVEDVLEPSPDRVACDAATACGGNVLAHVAPARQLTLKAEMLADAFHRIGRLELRDIPVAAGPADGYRMRARVHVRGSRWGFFEEGTHRLCDVRGSRQMSAPSADVIDRLCAAIGRAGGGANAEIEWAETADARGRAAHITLARADGKAMAALGTIAGLDGASWSAADCEKEHLLWGDVHLVGSPGRRGGPRRAGDPSRAVVLPGQSISRAGARRRRARAAYRNPGARPVCRCGSLQRGGRRGGQDRDRRSRGTTRQPTTCDATPPPIRRSPTVTAPWRTSWRWRRRRASTPSSSIPRAPGSRPTSREGWSPVACRGSSTCRAIRRRWPAMRGCSSTPATGSPRRGRSTCFPAPRHVETVLTAGALTARSISRRQASTNPSNRARNSPVRQKFSGCHWTPRQNGAGPLDRFDDAVGRRGDDLQALAPDDAPPDGDGC